MKKYNPTQVKLTTYEQEIENAITLKSIGNISEKDRKKFSKMATKTLKYLKTKKTALD